MEEPLTQQPLDEHLQSQGTTDNVPSLRITPIILQYWKESAGWGLFLSILGFLFVGIYVLAFLGAVFAISTLEAEGLPALGGLLLFIALVGIPTWFLFNFARYIRSAAQSGDLDAAQIGFIHLRRLFQFTGILTVAVLVLYALSILITLLSS